MSPSDTKEKAAQAFKEACAGHSEADFGYALLGKAGRWGALFRKRWARYARHLPHAERSRMAGSWMQRTADHAPGGITDFH